jgi:hypothetical protein
MLHPGKLLWSLALVFPAAAGDQWSLRAETGTEYDSNAARLYRQAEGDWLNRLLVEGRGSANFGLHRFGATALVGGKLFWHQPDQDIFLWRIFADWAWMAPQDLELGAEAFYYDSVMEVHLRDWRQLQTRCWLKLGRGGWLEARLWAGGSWFVFKPDDSRAYQVKLSHAGPLAGARLSLLPEENSAADVFYELELAWFGYRALERYQGVLVQSAEQRRDLLHQAGLSLRRRLSGAGWRMVGELSWRIAASQSNSFGSSALRHRLRLAVAVQLPRGFSLQLLGGVQFNSFPDGVYLEGNVYQPDADENENSLVLRAQYEFWRGLGVYLQGALYRSAFRAGTESLPDFAREVAGFGLFYENW